MAELVDAPDSGSGRETGGCSSHLDRIFAVALCASRLFLKKKLLIIPEKIIPRIINGGNPSMKLHSFIFKLLFSWALLCSTSASHALQEEAAHAQVYSLVTQTPISGTGTLVKMETVQDLNNFELSPSKDLLIARKDGNYLILITTQVGATTPGARGYVDYWAVKNGKPIPNSNNRQSVVISTFASTITTGYITPLAAGDTIGTMLSASGPSLGLVYIKPNAEPAIPSMNFTITRL